MTISYIQPKPHVLKISNNRILDVSQTHIMGILNVTPDSFSDGGKHNTLNTALKQCEKMLNHGATIIDIGGESTRPDAPEVAQQEEIDRVLPILEAVKNRFDTAVSIDTSSPKLMQLAHAQGADIWNDVRALRREGALDMAALLDIPVMMMHMRGDPGTMMSLTDYDHVVTDVKSELTARIELALQAGVKHENIIADVGFGFAKNTQQNYELLYNLHEFHSLGFPLMIGLSRKRMLADALQEQGLDSAVENRIAGGTSASLLAVQQGVSIIRTHDVLATAQALSVWKAMQKYNTSI